jgi:hypothetical protein
MTDQIAETIKKQLLRLELECGDHVNILDAIATFRGDKDVGRAKELVEDFAVWAADAVRKLPHPATPAERVENDK